MKTVPVDDLPLVDSALLQSLALLKDDAGLVTVLTPRGAESERAVHAMLRRGGDALSGLADEAAVLANPRLHGPAHGLVAALSSGDRWRFELPQEVPILVSVGPRAAVVPIARAFDEARPVGIVDARLDHVRILEAAGGDASELAGVVIYDTGDWTQYLGPARANPIRSAESSSQRERFDRRKRVQRSRAIADVGTRISQLARTRHWRAVVIAGDAHLTGELVPDVDLSIRLPEHLPDWDSAGELARELAGVLADARQRATAAFAEAAHDHPDGFAVGTGPVSAAIDDGIARAVAVDDRASDPEVGEVIRNALAHDLDVFFANDRFDALKAVVCSLHGSGSTR